MAAIQPIDGAFLLNAFRQGRSDRVSQLEDQLKIQKAQRDAQSQQQLNGVLGQIFGGNGGGVAGQMAAPPSQPTENGSPSPAQGLAPAPALSGPPQMDMNAMGQLFVLNPEMAGKVVTAFKTMGDADLQRQQQKNTMMGAAAHFVQQGRTPEERKALFDHAVPQLVAAGWTQPEIAKAEGDLSDQALQGFQALASDYDKLIDRELKEREFEAGKVEAVPQGGSLMRVRPDAPAEMLVAPNPGGMPAGAPVGAPVKVTSPDEARRLPPGTHFIDPDGVERVVPGGGSGNAAGGFPNIERYYSGQ